MTTCTHTRTWVVDWRKYQQEQVPHSSSSERGRTSALFTAKFMKSLSTLPGLGSKCPPVFPWWLHHSDDKEPSYRAEAAETRACYDHVHALNIINSGKVPKISQQRKSLAFFTSFHIKSTFIWWRRKYENERQSQNLLWGYSH